jgi:DNA-binding MarR family transcriptional regulator
MSRPAPPPPPDAADGAATALDPERYVPAFLTWIANKLSRGASQHYLQATGVGIETWRCLVQLALDGTTSAQQVARVIGMDKAAVSRCFKAMQADGLIAFAADADDGRVRLARLTPKGRRLHDQILGIALERERVFLSVLDAAERETLIGLLKRLHDHLPAVDAATADHVTRHFPKPRPRTSAPRKSP